jgi:hypothetical protein
MQHCTGSQLGLSAAVCHGLISVGLRKYLGIVTNEWENFAGHYGDGRDVFGSVDYLDDRKVETCALRQKLLVGFVHGARRSDQRNSI